MAHPLTQLVKDHKTGNKKGIVSVCSANRFVLEAAMIHAKRHGEFALIEATANQVNQFGGYTGMKPNDFAAFARGIARDKGLEPDKLILGGDHLGPLAWADKSEAAAMENAEELVRQYVLAGFTKIHIDTSMKLAGDDPGRKLPDETIAIRGAALCKAAENAYRELRQKDKKALAPVYVIGSEVPVPGGIQNTDEPIKVTEISDFQKTVEVFRGYFEKCGLAKAWNRVVAVVVQPGVEFGDVCICEYDRKKARSLTGAIKDYPGLVFEGHSTDYQTRENLRQMVEDGIAILKVGPALTFALREALFALSDIESEISAVVTAIEPSNFKVILENAMLEKPDNWLKHYHGQPHELAFKRKFSFSDRCRYYFPDKNVDAAISKMLKNLVSAGISLALLSQYMPVQYHHVRTGMIQNDPMDLIYDKIINCLDEYAFGCGRTACRN